MKLNNRFYVNNVYRTDAGELVVFLGYQDAEGFGFFRELKKPNTFFGLRLSKIVFTYEE